MAYFITRVRERDGDIQHPLIIQAQTAVEAHQIAIDYTDKQGKEIIADVKTGKPMELSRDLLELFFGVPEGNWRYISLTSVVWTKD